jgi:hypothetical protein
LPPIAEKRFHVTSPPNILAEHVEAYKCI